jgi:putative PIG3 family NAD(P)H quinone oxidoreductase
MKAIQVKTDKKDRPLVWCETDEPIYDPQQVLVDIYATSLNRADLMQRAGRYPSPPGAPDILGLDVAGRIAQLGKEVTGWRVGDRVCALLAGGGYAERVAVSQQMLMPVPDDWSYEEAAAMPEVFMTAFVNLFMEAAFQTGEIVLMHGGASGVGTAAIQLIREAGGCMIVTAGTEAKIARCSELGADLAINYRTEDFVAHVQEFTAGEGVDVILDIVGADYLARNVSLLKSKGRLVLISTLSGSTAQLDLRMLMGRRLKLIGSVLRSRSLEEKVEIKERFVARFWPLLEDGTIQPVIDSVYPIEEANEAHQRMAENQNIGKIILRVRS